MGQASISTSQRSVRSLPVGATEAVVLKNQRPHDAAMSEDFRILMVAINS